MNDHTGHDPSAIRSTGPALGRIVTVLVVTVAGLAGAVGSAVGQPAPAGSPAAVTRPLPDNDDRKGDDQPCGEKVTTEGGQEALICPDWSPTGRIEVFRSPKAGSEVIGHINPAGEDFYFCQTKGGRHQLGEFVNEWWALTDADGEAGIGWVPETYFRGGGANEKDAVLQDCPKRRS